MSAIPVAAEAEEATLSAVLLAPKMLDSILGRVRLEATHFYDQRNGRIFAAMIALSARDEPIDSVTLGAELSRSGVEGLDSRIADLSIGAPNASNAVAYAERIVEVAALRSKRDAALAVLDAIGAEDAVAIADAEARLSVSRSDREVLSASQVADRVFEYLSGGAAEGIAFPWDALTRATGGLKPGTVTLLGGWSSHGKSVLIDQILDSASKRSSAHLFINEMTVEQRALRWIARNTAAPYSQIANGKIDGYEGEVAEALGRLPYGITDAAGWTETDIAAEIVRGGWDVVGVDILHLIDHAEERDLARISRALNLAAKRSGAAIVATVHLNEKRIIAARRPPPTLGDIRGSGMLKNDADNVLMVFREQDEEGVEVMPEGRVYVAKARNGALRTIPVELNAQNMRFDLAG
jgi:replicative DNA helicase